MEYILVVDDNQNMQFILSNILGERGYEVDCVGNGNEAIQKAKERIPDLVLLDIRLPGRNGFEVLQQLKELDQNILVIMITAYGDLKSAVKAIKMGAYDYVSKPFDNEELILTIKRAWQTRNLSREVEILKKQLQNESADQKVMGTSQQITRIIKQVKLVAPTNISVIIEGKSGTGKEVIASMIHQFSNRAAQPFIAVDCGAIPETLVESELMGYEKGAFTGAEGTKKGNFELADGGTLFLDEISNLPLAAQAKLLRVIQERQFRRIGGVKPINIDIRIIVATNLNLSTMVNEGKFRDDLFHRLSEFKITLPLLKDREEDIAVLAQQFLLEANLELGKQIRGFTPEALKKMLAYEWPGNIRELKQAVTRAVLLAEDEFIVPDNLYFETSLSQHQPFQKNIQDYLEQIIDQGASLSDIINELNSKIEKEIIQKILAEVRFNKSRAAKVLGIDRNTLYAKMKNLDIE
ncbi:MAG: sigma-54-dependent Fis family transcriptional regulator [Candidatus Cloacimonetes bacterium]|nr:sigma-54-dependent Fis family transcriptional regulator [Candidatus Cloacimonadota bacterium]